MAPPAGTTPPALPEQAARTPKIPQPRDNPAHPPTSTTAMNPQWKHVREHFSPSQKLINMLLSS